MFSPESVQVLRGKAFRFTMLRESAHEWLCGRAAEIAIFNGNQSEQSLLPRDVLDHLGDAFKEL